ncbi:MAG TPA: hypothetical protein VEK12_20190 [Alphaproteobacteria bacterium]|nr:hypothetical protein [Alphaproteobacteria bacterium]
MPHTVISRLARVFGRLGLALMLALGVLFLALPAQAQRHGGGGWHGGWHGGYCCGLGFGFWGWPYYYPYPYYPDYYAYPDYYPPVAPAVVAPPAPAAPAGAPAASNMWYYCDNPKGYYPYVQNCSTAWRQVPATPPKQ